MMERDIIPSYRFGGSQEGLAAHSHGFVDDTLVDSITNTKNKNYMMDKDIIPSNRFWGSQEGLAAQSHGFVLPFWLKLNHEILILLTLPQMG
jgi:hypothetical protein